MSIKPETMPSYQFHDSIMELLCDFLVDMPIPFPKVSCFCHPIMLFPHLFPTTPPSSQVWPIDAADPKNVWFD